MPVVDVVIGVIINNDQQILLARRQANKHQGGLWEFPGGKIESGETILAALQRELNEEVGIEVKTAEHLLTSTHDYGDRRIRLEVFMVCDFNGQACGREGQEIIWVTLQQLNQYDFPIANQPVVQTILKRLG